MLVTPEGPLRFTADDVNLLIHAYLQDSGFEHSAFVIRMEAKLEQSPSFNKHIPRGELVELLAKALLFVEVESHWKPNAQENCKTSFSLLEPHVCSLEPNPIANAPFVPVLPPPSARNNGVVNDILDANAKRKADTPSGDDQRAEKRPRTDESEKKSDLKPKPLPVPSLEGKKTPQIPRPTPTKSNAVRLIKGHVNEVFVCAWNPAKPNILATGSKDAVVKIWDLSVGGDSPPSITQDFSTAEQGDLTALHWSPDGTLLAVGSYDSILRVCTVDGELYFSHAQHKGPIFAARFSPSGKWLLTASLDGTTCVWNVQTKAVHMQYQAHSDCCLDIDWIDDEAFTSCGADNLIYIMKVGQSQPLRTLSGHHNEINQIKCNPSSTLIATCSDDTTARIWKIAAPANNPDKIPGLAPNTQHLTLKGHRHCVSGIDWCPRPPSGSSDILATSSFDGTARFWDAVTGECLHTFSDHKRPVYALSFSPDGRWFSTGGGDGFLYIYSTETKNRVFSWHAGFEKPGVFEIDWQQASSLSDSPREFDRLALALECRQVGVVDVSEIPAMHPL